MNERERTRLLMDEWFKGKALWVRTIKNIVEKEKAKKALK